MRIAPKKLRAQYEGVPTVERLDVWLSLSFAAQRHSLVLHFGMRSFARHHVLLQLVPGGPSSRNLASRPVRRALVSVTGQSRVTLSLQ